MDLLAHAVYGATVCSRSGLAGGRRGAGVTWWRDGTVWAAVAVGVLPDAASMGLPFVLFLAGGVEGTGVRWWLHGWVMGLYWGILAAVWMWLSWWRGRVVEGATQGGLDGPERDGGLSG